MDINDQARIAWGRLMAICPDAEKDEDAKQRAIIFLEDKLAKGWTIAEVVAHMRWAEEFDPHVEEYIALREMKRVTDQVALRMTK